MAATSGGSRRLPPAAGPCAALALTPTPIRPPAQPFLESQGIHAPTDVQAAAIPVVLQGANAAIRCYTGSGKTLAYLLPALSLAVARAEAEWAQVTRKTAGQAGTVQARWGRRTGAAGPAWDAAFSLRQHSGVWQAPLCTRGAGPVATCLHFLT